jgi:hypothetical protein
MDLAVDQRFQQLEQRLKQESVSPVLCVPPGTRSH